MTSNLTPDILAALAQWQPGQPLPQLGGYTYQPNMGTVEGPNGAPVTDYFGGVQSWDRQAGDLRRGGARDQFGTDGTYSHSYTGQGESPLALDLAKWALMAAGVGAAGGALTGAGFGSGFGMGADALGDAVLGGAGADAAAGAGGAGFDAATSAGLSSADKAALYGASGYGPGMTGSQVAAFDNILNLTGSTTMGNAASTVTSALEKVLGASPWMKLAGGALGAMSNGDQTKTVSAGPWAPAQPFLQSLLGQAQDLNQRYQQTPLSDAQRTAYSNTYGPTGLLGAINSGAQGLMGGFAANASGANNYNRADPRKPLTGSTFNLSGFAPGLLNLFPQGA